MGDRYARAVSRAFLVVVILSASGACGGEVAPPPAAPSPALTTIVAPATPPTPPPDPARAVAVAQGSGFACALRANGRVACWGDDTEGQLGQGHTDPVEGAREVVHLDDAIALAATASSACAVRAGGGVVCWGRGRTGELGGGDDRRSGGRLVPVAGVAGADAIWAGMSRYCARTGAHVTCWGARDAALDTQVSGISHVTVPHEVPLEGVERMSLGWSRYAFLRDGRVLRWGSSTEAPSEVRDVRDAFGLVNEEYLARADGTVVRVPREGEMVSVEALRDAVALGGTSSQIHGLAADGRLRVVSRYDDRDPVFERSEGLATLAPGEGGVLAITREGLVRGWRATDSTSRRFVAVDLVLPATGVDPPEPAPPTGPLPGWCRLEVRAVTPSTAPSLVALWGALVRDPDDDETPPADEAEARRWLCAQLPGGLADCDTDGPILFQKRDYGGTALAWLEPDGSTRWIEGLGVLSDGTEEATFLERAEVRDASALEVMLEISENEQSCFGEEGDETCGLGEARRRVFLTLAREGSVVIAELELRAGGMRRAGVTPESLASPRMRIEGGSLVVEGCGGRASRPLPRAEAEAVLPSTTVPSPREPPIDTSSAAPVPSSAEVEAAATRCGAGFSQIGAGDLVGARREIEGALVVLERGTDDRGRRALGACLYNLGRVEEGEGRVDAARAAYRRSLEVRPNATVAARVRALGP